MRNHVKNAHKPNEENKLKTYSCTTCSFKSNFIADLRDHLTQVHQNQQMKPFSYK